MWDEEDGFFYDVLRLPDGQAGRLKVRSLVGLMPMCAVMVFEQSVPDRVPNVRWRTWHSTANNGTLHTYTGPALAIAGCSRVWSDERRLRRMLARLLDEKEFWGPYGVRAISRYHLEHPYVLNVGGQEYKVQYCPAESDSGTFGGNSNWRGPVWMPMNLIIYRSLMQWYRYYGDDFKVECPTGSGTYKTLFEVAQELGDRIRASS